MGRFLSRLITYIEIKDEPCMISLGRNQNTEAGKELDKFDDYFSLWNKPAIFVLICNVKTCLYSEERLISILRDKPISANWL